MLKKFLQPQSSSWAEMKAERLNKPLFTKEIDENNYSASQEAEFYNHKKQCERERTPAYSDRIKEADLTSISQDC